MAAGSELTGTAGTQSDPSTRNFPAVPFSSKHFHKSCAINDYQNPTEVRDCELSGLPDLDQSQEAVRSKIVDFMNQLLDLGVAGFRMDACKHMWPEDLKAIYGTLKGLNRTFGYRPEAKPFIFQEVIDLGMEAVSR
jgi:alpha-amylase